MAKVKVMLNLGSGREYRNPESGWINIDNQQMYHGDFKVDMQADFLTLKWKKNSVDGILANHIFQYITPTNAEICLKRWYGWLKKGGEIIIEAGDIQKVAASILKAKTVEELHGKNGIMQLYGIDENIWNKWAWCPTSLYEELTKAGFKDIRCSPGYYHHNPDRDFVMSGKK